MATASQEPAPPKPWEKNGAAGVVGRSVTDSIAQNGVGTPPQSTPNPVQTAENMNSQANPSYNSSNQLSSTYNNGQTTYGNSGIPNNNSYGNGYNSGYNNNNSPYSSGYGGYRSPYGGMGMMNGYGGGMYGNGMYGGGMYGNGMNGMMSPYGTMGTPMSNFGMMLGSMHHATSSLGQMGELMGMNADALQYAFHMIFGFFERVGFGVFELMNFATGRVDLSVYEQNPVIDPRNGQPLPPPTVEQVQRQRKEKLIRWTVGVLVLFLGYKVAKFLILRSFQKKLSAAEKLQRRWTKVTGIPDNQNSNSLSEALGIYPPQANPMMNQMSPYSPYGMGMNSYSGGMYGSPYSSMYGNNMNMYNRGGMYGNSYSGGYGSYDDIF